jgi:ketosteroid isomerase-like protein
VIAASGRDVETVRSIERTVLDYFEGWFEGDVERMRRALHPDLVKRRAGETLGTTTAARMLELTEQGEGRTDLGPIEIAIADVRDDVASVTVRGGPYHEYLHLVRTGDGWRIANALWQYR